MRFADGVLIAGDRQATAGYEIADRNIQKVFEADEYSAIAVAGVAGPAIEMAKVLRTQLEFYEKVQAHPWADRYMVMTPRHFPLQPLRALLDLTHALGSHGRHPVVGHAPSQEYPANAEHPKAT